MSLSELAGCEQHPCAFGNACTYREYSLFCTPCAGATVGEDGISCEACEVGKGPNADQTMCEACAANEYGVGVCQPCVLPLVVSTDKLSCTACPAGEGPAPGEELATDRSTCIPCVGNTFSSFGIQCALCPDGTATNYGRVQCEDFSKATVTNVALVTEVLGSSNVLPKTSVEITAAAAALVSSRVQDTLVASITTDMVAALGIEPNDIAISGLRAPSALADGRRRAQATAVVFDFVITSANAGAVLADFDAQVLPLNLTPLCLAALMSKE